MERCRTCLSITDADESFQIFEKYFPPKTIKDVLLQYIPQMEHSLSENDKMCAVCFNTVKNFVDFIEKCMEIEEHLKSDYDVIDKMGFGTNVENIRIVLDYDVDGEVASSSKKPVTRSVVHDHSYIRNASKKNKVEETTSMSEDANQSLEQLEQENYEVETLNFVPANEEMLGEEFMEVCSSEENRKLNSNITILATGDDELVESEEIQIKEESVETSDDGKYDSCEEQSTGCICEFCGEEFVSEYMLKEHYLTHGEVRLMCDKCPKIFKNESALKAHFRLKHMEVERFRCPFCNQQFGRADYLRNHLKRHEEEKQRDNVKCRVPGKFLRFKNTDDPLPCKICGKYYNGIQKLKVHLQTHLVVKRFACEFCDLTYKRWPSLKRHEKTHLEADTVFHRCNVCWKRFYTKDELEFHMTQHGNPRYRCQVCDEQFHRKYLFDNHYLLKHATPEDIENSKKEVIYDTLLELSSQNLLVPNKCDD